MSTSHSKIDQFHQKCRIFEAYFSIEITAKYCLLKLIGVGLEINFNGIRKSRIVVQLLSAKKMCSVLRVRYQPSASKYTLYTGLVGLAASSVVDLAL